MARVREKQIQKRRQETLDAAMRRLIEGGYANLNMDELADEVGISKPTLYQDFASKEELVAQAIVRLFEKIGEHLDDDPNRSPLEQLERFLRSMLQQRAEQRNIMTMMDGEALRAIMHRHPYPLQYMAETRSRLAKLVRQAQAQGEVDPDIPPWVVVALLFSMQGIVRHPIMKEDPQRSDREVAEAIESTIRIFLRGIRTPSRTA